MSSSRSIPTRDRTPENKPEFEFPPEETPVSQKLSSSLHHQVLNGKGSEEPSVKRKREVVEQKLVEEVIKGTIKGIMRLVEAVCHDSFLEVHPGQVIEDDALRRDGEWTEWPKATKTISEPKMEEFIKLIADTVDNLGLSSIEPRFWTSMFYRHPIPDPKWDTDYKPDLVLLQRFMEAIDRGSITWKDILAVMEIKSNKDQQAAADKQVARYAQNIFNAQPGRRFVIALTVVESKVTLWIFDRSGAISCEPFDIHEEPEKFLRIILGTFYFDMEQLGYDHTVYNKPESGDDLFIKVAGVEYKVNCIYHEPGIKGRGTVCYRGENQTDSSVVVIKDSWVDVSRRETEVEILEQLNKREEKDLCTPDGVRVIPKLVAHEIVKTHRPVEGQNTLVDDTTAIFRHEHVEMQDGKPKWVWTSKEKTTKGEVRVHNRVVMSPFGLNLENFKTLKGLMRAFGDVVHGTSTDAVTTLFLLSNDLQLQL